MVKPKVLVTGATGKTGAVVVSELLESGYPVRALVRRDDARSSVLRARGAEIAVADMCDVEQMTAAMRGVQRAYWLPPCDPNMLMGAAVFATAAKDAKLESIVSLTQWLASPSHPALLTRHHWLADQIFEMIPGVGLTILNPGLFAELPYLAGMSVAVHLGLLPWIFGEHKAAPPSVADIGRVAASALMDPARHAGRIYRPTGPKLLSGQDMAAVLTRVLGRTVRLRPTPMVLFGKAAKRDGSPLAVSSALAHYAKESKKGTFAMGAPNDHVAEVTGRAAESFEATVRRLAAARKYQRSTANTLREAMRFLLLPLYPGPASSRYLRGLHVTEPAGAQYAYESQVWRQEHGFDQPEPGDGVRALRTA
jgi:uncharacterized protein YbjT (DUF2867 family)